MTADDPLVERLVRLSEDHERLRDAIARLRQPDAHDILTTATPGIEETVLFPLALGALHRAATS